MSSFEKSLDTGSQLNISALAPTSALSPKSAIAPASVQRRTPRLVPVLANASLIAFCVLSVFTTSQANAQDDFSEVSSGYSKTALPLLKKYCLDCHATAKPEGELDLEQFTGLAEVRKHPETWVKVVEMLDNGEMPPKDSDQPTPEERKSLRTWVKTYLDAEAIANAGDPGPVVLRRLSNAEFTYTIQDLTGVALFPAREFPVDSASGEGFTNTGSSLVMSPAMVTKYLDAGKEISKHMVLLPDGIRFSPHQTRNDWTNDTLDRIREFYGRYSEHGGGDQVNLQGIIFATNDGGRLPIVKYLEATLAEREAIQSGKKSLASVAAERGLSEKYLTNLWQTLNARNTGSFLVDHLRNEWKAAAPADAVRLATGIAQWQNGLWRFTTVGHIGKTNGPAAWMEPVSPIAPRQEIRVPFPIVANPASPAATESPKVTLYLSGVNAGDNGDGDYIVWDRPRFVAPGRPDILLKDLGVLTAALNSHRDELFDSADRCLSAAAEAAAEGTSETDVAALAQKHNVRPEALSAWLDYLGIGTAGPARTGNLLSRKV